MDNRTRKRPLDSAQAGPSTAGQGKRHAQAPSPPIATSVVPAPTTQAPTLPSTQETPKTYAASGLKSSLHGTIYQLKLLALFLKRGLKKNISFKLGTEVDDAGKFDDVVFQYKQGDKSYCRFLQAKHRQDTLSKIKYRDLFPLESDSESKHMFCLKKYFTSYKTIMANVEKKKFGASSEVDDMILFTNVGVDHDDLNQNGITLVKNTVDPSDILHFGNRKCKQFKIEASKDSELHKKLRDCSDSVLLCKQLLKFVIDDKGKLQVESMFKACHEALVREKIIEKLPCVKGAKEAYAKFHPDFIYSNNLSSQGKSFRNVFENVLLNKSRYRWSDLQTKTFKISKAFGQSKEVQNLPSDEVSDDEIEMFLNKFSLAVDQPSEVELSLVLVAEFNMDFTLLRSEFIASHFLEYVLNWFKTKEGTYMTQFRGKDFIKTCDHRLDALISIGLKIDFCGQMNSFDTKFNEDALLHHEIGNLLTNNSQFQIMNIKCSEKTSLTSIRVLQTINSYPNFRELDSYLALRLSSLGDIVVQNRITNAFYSGGNHDLLIIDCDVKKRNIDIERFLEQLKIVLENLPEKRLIVIGDNCIEVASWIKRINVLSHTIHVQNQYDDLTKNSRVRLLEIEIDFQKTKMKLGHIDIVESLKQVPDFSDTFSNIMSGRFQLFSKLIFDKVINSESYIPRTFCINNILLPDLQMRDTLPESKDIICWSPEEFKNAVDANPNKNIHLLLQDGENVVWLETYGTVTNLRNFVDINRTESESDVISQMKEKKIVVLCDEAGTGKSTVLSRIAQLLKTETPQQLVVRIDLSDHTKILRNYQNVIIDFNATLEILHTILHFSNELEFAIFKTMLEKNGGIVLFLDGFDEISPNFESLVMDVISVLKDTKVNQIWVSSRPSMKDSLENMWNILSITFAMITEPQKINFLKSFWKLESKNAELERRLRTFAINTLSKFSRSTNNIDFTSTPLHLTMLATILKKDAEQSLDNESSNVNQDIMNIESLFTLFMNEKYKIAISKAKEGTLANDAIADFLQLQTENVEKLHQYSAVNFIFSEEIVQYFPKFQKLQLQTVYHLARIGIVQVLDNNIRFSHQLFADYYASRFISTTINENISDQYCRFLVDSIFNIKKSEGTSHLKFGRTGSKQIRRFLNCDENITNLSRDTLLTLKAALSMEYATNALQLAILEDHLRLIIFITQCFKFGECENELLVCEMQPHINAENAMFSGNHEAARNIIPLEFSVDRNNISAFQYLLDCMHIQYNTSEMEHILKTKFPLIIYKCLRWTARSETREAFNIFLSSLPHTTLEILIFLLERCQTTTASNERFSVKFDDFLKVKQLIIEHFGTDKFNEFRLKYSNLIQDSVHPFIATTSSVAEVTSNIEIASSQFGPDLVLNSLLIGNTELSLWNPIISHFTAKHKPNGNEDMLKRTLYIIDWITTHCTDNTNIKNMLSSVDEFNRNMLMICAAFSPKEVMKKILNLAALVDKYECAALFKVHDNDDGKTMLLLSASNYFGSGTFQLVLDFIITNFDSNTIQDILLKQCGDGSLIQHLFSLVPAGRNIDGVNTIEEHAKAMRICVDVFRSQSHKIPSSAVQLLLEDSSEHGENCLHYMAYNGYVEVLEPLVAVADERLGQEFTNVWLRSRDEYGENIFHKAASEGHVAYIVAARDLVFTRLGQGVLAEMMNETDADGDTPYATAELQEHLDLLEYLKPTAGKM